jgi:C-terminal binding protein
MPTFNHALRRFAPLRRICSAAARRPLVGIIDMENRSGSTYTPETMAEQIETHELADTARVVYTGASCIEEVDPAVLSELDAVMLRRCVFGAPQLDLLPRLRCVLRMGAGYDNVDVNACSLRNVVACNSPDAWVEEVADSSMCLLIALARRTFALTTFVSRGGGWTRQAGLPARGIRRLRGLRLGIVGLGRIGKAVAVRAKAFGFDVSFYDPYLPEGSEKSLGGLTRTRSFAALVGGCEALSFHCPLTEETRHMLSSETLPRVGEHPGLFVVNAARGGVLDEAALLSGLADGRVLGAALDSLEGEPAVPPALLEAQAAGELNLLLTPHAAFYSDEAFEEMRHLAAREVRRVLRGEPALCRVN